MLVLPNVQVHEQADSSVNFIVRPKGETGGCGPMPSAGSDQPAGTNPSEEEA